MDLGTALLILLAPLASTDPVQEAVSMEGKPLYRPEIPQESRALLQQNLAAAKSEYEKNPERAESLIWYGRRIAYLGHYRESIEIFSQGIEKHPRDPRMYRHRGHRYLTVREIDHAVRDLEKAAELIQGVADEVEPDGIPNSKNIPRSTTNSNIWYHLGLAYYLKGEFEKAEHSYRKCLEFSANDDMLVATLHWLYMTLRRQGKNTEAAEVLKPVRDEMEIFEDVDYHNLLLMYQGKKTPESMQPQETAEALSSATIGYGIANWYFYNGDTEKAHALFRKIVDGREWAAFGYLAAEAELARKK